MGRHRLDRVPWVGVPRAAVRARMDRQRQLLRDPRRAGPQDGRVPVVDALEFFVHQARIPVGGGG